MGSNGKRKGKGGGASKVKAATPANGAPSVDGGESEKAKDEGVPAESHRVDAPAEEPPELLPSDHGAAWAAPLYRFDMLWTKVESRLLVVVLIAELGSLCAWVLLNDLTDAPGKAGSDGTIFRGLLGAVAFGLLAWFGAKKQAYKTRTAITIGAIVVGAAIAPAWRGVGVAYLDNIKGWLQEGSTLTLMGGLRGVATRLTLWLALLGGSLATGAGRHIHIDLVYRLLPKRFRLPASLVNSAFAAIVCFAAVWGFVDHIAINSFGSKAEDSAGTKISTVAHEMGQHLFLARKQVGLDFRSLPHVLAGDRYDQWMTGKAWNSWVDDADFAGSFPAEQVQSIKVPDDTPTHVPLVISPDGTTTRGLLVHLLGLVFPFGLLAIGLRFVLRAILTVSGHYTTDPDEAHREEFGHAEGGL